MKKYVKPELNAMKISNTDIIQTSGLIVGGEGNNDNPMEWSLRRTTNSEITSEDLYK